MYDTRMKDFIEKHNLLYSSQYGRFVKVTQPNMACGVFIDLKKPLIL